MMILKGFRRGRVCETFPGVADLPWSTSALSITTQYARSYGSTRAKSAHTVIGVNDADSSRLRINSKTVKDFERSSRLKISDEVRAALEENRPVVALESTVYTHGWSYPDNAALAVELEGILRDQGVTPATIGLIDGVAQIGMNALELHSLAAAGGRPSTMKVSRRDLPYLIGMGLAGKKINGGTTIAGTMFLAEMCGIKVFATGGLGGVHRGGEDTMDISADLTELGRTSMCVIASGCKSFLDIPRTLEFLETQGVTVATFSENKETKTLPFPAFYTTDSGVASPFVVTSPEEAAAIIYAQELLGPSFGSGFFLANPIPAEHSIAKEEIDSAINRAVEEAEKQGIRGHANTPFILSHIKNVTAGRSVAANRALIRSNVALGAQVAKYYGIIQQEKSEKNAHQGSAAFPTGHRVIPPNHVSTTSNSRETNISHKDLGVETPNVDIMVFGSLAVDLSCDYSPLAKTFQTSPEAAHSPVLHTSNPSTISTAIGGVGHNVALAAQRAGGEKLNVRLCSYIADDVTGATALQGLQNEGLDKTGIRTLPSVEEAPDGTTKRNHTAQYVAFNDVKKDLFMAMADMAILDNRDYQITSEAKDWRQINSAKWTVIDGNLDSQAILSIATDAQQRGSKVAFEPVSTHKSTRLLKSVSRQPLPPFPNHKVDLASPNQYELAAMYAAAKENGLMEQPQWWEVIDVMGIPSSGARDRFVHLTNAKMTDAGIPVQAIQLLPFIPTILTKLGADGVLHTELLARDDPRLTDPDSAPYILSRTNVENSLVGGVYMRLFPPVGVVKDIVSVNGVGDTFLGVLIAGLAIGMPLNERLVNVAQRGAVLTLRSAEAVSPRIQGLLTTEA